MRALSTKGPETPGLIFSRETDGFVVSVPEKKPRDLVIRADELIKDAAEKKAGCEKGGEAHRRFGLRSLLGNR